MKQRGGGAIVNAASIMGMSEGLFLTVPIFSNPELVKPVMPHTPLGRLPEVEDIAAAILFLCSPAARCITGIVLPVDSGYLAR